MRASSARWIMCAYSPSEKGAYESLIIKISNMIGPQPLSPNLPRGEQGLGLGGFLEALLVLLRALGGTLNFQNFFLVFP